MKKIKAAMLAAFFGSAMAMFAVQAPEGGHAGGQHHHGPPSAQEHLAHMSKELNLTDDQKAKIKTILDDEHTQMEALHQDESTGRSDKMAKMKSIHESNASKIREVLNADQQKKFDEMEKRHKEGMMRHGPPPEGAPHGGPGSGN